ncbi:MAG: hypothetical protein CMN72_07790 [Sphingomonas sp.]|nr:hypothetical protein [Sphingomonas sp.]
MQRRHELYRVTQDMSDAGERKERQGRMEDATCDAIGRAFTAGLLHSDTNRARQMLDAGRKVAAQYWRTYGFVTPDSLARFQPQRPAVARDDERDKAAEKALAESLGIVRAKGPSVRRAFDQIVIDINPDCGPAWLDAIVLAHRRHMAAAERDLAMLRLAVEGLEAIV